MTLTELNKRIAELQRQLDLLKREVAEPIRTVKVGDLEWQADVPDQTFTWQEAKDYATSLGEGWRLPTITELLTLVDYDKNNPACSVFPDCPSEYFWSSSALFGSTTRAWDVYFNLGNGSLSDVGNTYRVRCVR